MQSKKIFNKSDKILIAIVGSLLALPTIFNIGVIVILWFWVLNDGADVYKIKRDREEHKAFLERMKEEGRLLSQEKLGYEKFDCVLSEDGQWKEYHGEATMLGEVLFYDHGEAHYDVKRDKNGNAVIKRFAFKVRPVNIDTLSAVKVILRDMEEFFQQDDNWKIKNYLVRNYNETMKKIYKTNEREEKYNKRIRQQKIIDEANSNCQQNVEIVISSYSHIRRAILVPNKEVTKKILYWGEPLSLLPYKEYEVEVNDTFDSFVDKFIQKIVSEGGTDEDRNNCYEMFLTREERRGEEDSDYKRLSDKEKKEIKAKIYGKPYYFYY